MCVLWQISNVIASVFAQKTEKSLKSLRVNLNRRLISKSRLFDRNSIKINMKEGTDMKKRLQGVVIGFVLALILTGTVAFAATGAKTLTANYRDIKIIIDDVPITPRDANGNIVEPFIVDGTTYLPVRAVGEALGMNVTWDGVTGTVFLDSIWEEDYSIEGK